MAAFPPRTALLVAGALILAACSGRHDGTASPAAPSPAPAPPPPQRGAVVGSPARLGSFGPGDLLARLPGGVLGEGLAQLALSPACTVDAWHVDYHTVGARDEPTTASAALLVPSGGAPACQGPRPVLVYAHGTRTDRNSDLARLDDPANGEGLAVALTFAAQGFLVVAPNYAGYDTSTLPYHPYLVADQQSKDAIDALAAARSTLPATGASAGSALFVTGYSQGGYVALATERALEAAGTPVTAAAGLSGPYALAAFADAAFLGQVNASAVPNFALLATAYQHAYGDLYATPGDVFEAKYAPTIDALLPNATPLATLVDQGRLPAEALFSATPPAPEFAAQTPATAPATLAPVFARGFGSDFLVTNDFRLAYLRDQQAHPDGGFPTVSTGLPPDAPGNALRRALARNDLRSSTPRAPVLLCGGASDPTVFFSNTTLLRAYWSGAAPAADVTVLDLESGSGPYGNYRDAFGVVKAAVAATDGEAGVLSSYHAGLVAPFCLAAARDFFAAH
jgi:dienelactone hydrolase